MQTMSGGVYQACETVYDKINEASKDIFPKLVY